MPGNEKWSGVMSRALWRSWGLRAFAEGINRRYGKKCYAELNFGKTRLDGLETRAQWRLSLHRLHPFLNQPTIVELQGKVSFRDA
jgi:hypothetical protein